MAVILVVIAGRQDFQRLDAPGQDCRMGRKGWHRRLHPGLKCQIAKTDRRREQRESQQTRKQLLPAPPETGSPVRIGKTVMSTTHRTEGSNGRTRYSMAPSPTATGSQQIICRP